jgi:hypothetical protein
LVLAVQLVLELVLAHQVLVAMAAQLRVLEPPQQAVEVAANTIIPKDDQVDLEAVAELLTAQALTILIAVEDLPETV